MKKSRLIKKDFSEVIMRLNIVITQITFTEI